jgi:hypothetical protein
VSESSIAQHGMFHPTMFLKTILLNWNRHREGLCEGERSVTATVDACSVPEACASRRQAERRSAELMMLEESGGRSHSGKGAAKVITSESLRSSCKAYSRRRAVGSVKSMR